MAPEKGGSRDDFCAWLFVTVVSCSWRFSFRDGVFLVIIRIKTLWSTHGPLAHHATVAFTTTLPGHVL